MAVNYESIAIQSTLTNDGTDQITVDRPASTASGDLLVAILVQSRNDSTNLNSPFTSSGWEAVTNRAHNDGSTDYVHLTVLAKVAGGSEPANYTFDSGVNASALGAIIRWTGDAFVGAANVQATTDIETTDTTPTYTPGLTPMLASQGFLMGVLAFGDGTNTVSDYSIATSNPSWTERMDQDEAGSFDAVLAFATAIRAEATATGDYSLAFTGTPTGSIGFLLSIHENINAEVTATPVSLTLSPQAPTATGTASVAVGAVSLTASVPTPSASGAAPKWENIDKSSSGSINNVDKS